MSSKPVAAAPRIALGSISVVLGSIALALFFLPILCIPIAIFGLLAGIARIVRFLVTREMQTVPHVKSEMRWSIIGCALCMTVVVLDFIVAYAPLGETPRREPPLPFWTPPGQAYVSPPAQPR